MEENILRNQTAVLNNQFKRAANNPLKSNKKSVLMHVSRNDQENFTLSPKTNRKAKVKDSLATDNVIECG